MASTTVSKTVGEGSSPSAPAVSEAEGVEAPRCERGGSGCESRPTPHTPRAAEPARGETPARVAGARFAWPKREGRVREIGLATRAMGGRLAAGRRVLAPETEVRILASQLTLRGAARRLRAPLGEWSKPPGFHPGERSVRIRHGVCAAGAASAAARGPRLDRHPFRRPARVRSRMRRRPAWDTHARLAQLAERRPYKPCLAQVRALHRVLRKRSERRCGASFPGSSKEELAAVNRAMVVRVHLGELVLGR
jgi:hypothetical protein